MERDRSIDQEEEGEDRGKDKRSWVPNMFTAMFNGDGKTPKEEDDPRRKSPRESKATDGEKRGSIFTPVAGLIDAARRSLSRSDTKRRSQPEEDDGRDANGGRASMTKGDKENRKKSHAGGHAEDFSQEGGGSRASERSGRRRRRSRSRGSRHSRGNPRGSDLDLIEDPAVTEKKRRDEYDQKIERQKQ